MDPNDKDYIDGFNLGWEIERATQDKTMSKKDKELIKSVQTSLEKSSGKSDKLEGIKAGVQQFKRSKELEMLKEKSHNNERER